MMTVTTIIPVHDRPVQLREAVDSVLAQTHPDIEIIIVDDGSTDDTPAVAEELAKAHPGIVRVIHQPNTGPGPARQAGLEAARGGFIQFLDSDDLLLPHKFALQLEGLKQDAEAGISYGLTLVEDTATGHRQVTHGTDVCHRQLFPAVLVGRIWATCTPLYRRELCERIGPWRSRRVLEDWDYDCRAGLLGVKLQYCEQPLAIKRHGLDDHAGLAWQTDPAAMQDWFEGYIAVAAHAVAANVELDSPEVRSFSRSLFWMARLAGQNGYLRYSKRLLELASQFSVRPDWGLQLYRLGSKMLGLGRTASAAAWMEKLKQSVANG